MSENVLDQEKFKNPPKDLWVGSIHTTNNYGDIEILEYTDTQNILIKFLETGSKRVVSGGSIRSGRIKNTDFPNRDFVVGGVFETNNCGSIEIVEYNSFSSVQVKFTSTGNIKTTSASQIKKGTVRDIMYSKGMVFPTKSCGDVEIVEWNGHKDVLVTFLNTGSLLRTSTTEINSGYLKDLFSKDIFGVGFLGKGPYMARPSGETLTSYNRWYGMLRRCYDPKLLNKNPTYRDCCVCESWHNFQNFAKWFDDNYIEGYHLDKDILVEGNKVYSPDTCVFVPQAINNFLTEHGNDSGDFPIGVHFDTRKGKFCSQISKTDILTLESKRVYLGHFSNEHEAHLAWADAKLGIVKQYIACGVLGYDKRIECAILKRYENYLQVANKKVDLFGGDV